MAPKIYPHVNFKFKHSFERGSTNFKPKIVLGIHEVESSRQKELRNYLTQILEPTLTTIEMDVEIEIFLATYGPNVGIPESISLEPIATPTITK
jgi:hypothetical protein